MMRLLAVLAVLAVASASSDAKNPDPHCNHGHSGPSPAPAVRPLPRCRPPAANRSYSSAEVEKQLAKLMARKWKDSELSTLLWNSMPNTLDTTVWASPDCNGTAGGALTPGCEKNNESFVSTGDQVLLCALPVQHLCSLPVLPTLPLACCAATCLLCCLAAANGSPSCGEQASMYLRDSMNQVLPYMRYAKAEPDGIGLFLRGIIERYTSSVLLDPCAL